MHSLLISSGWKTFGSGRGSDSGVLPKFIICKTEASAARTLKSGDMKYFLRGEIKWNKVTLVTCSFNLLRFKSLLEQPLL